MTYASGGKDFKELGFLVGPRNQHDDQRVWAHWAEDGGWGFHPTFGRT